MNSKTFGIIASAVIAVLKLCSMYYEKKEQKETKDNTNGSEKNSGEPWNA
jgi:hypothetical protein